MLLGLEPIALRGHLGLVGRGLGLRLRDRPAGIVLGLDDRGRDLGAADRALPATATAGRSRVSRRHCTTGDLLGAALGRQLLAGPGDLLLARLGVAHRHVGSDVFPLVGLLTDPLGRQLADLAFLFLLVGGRARRALIGRRRGLARRIADALVAHLARDRRRLGHHLGGPAREHRGRRAIGVAFRGIAGLRRRQLARSRRAALLRCVRDLVREQVLRTPVDRV